MAKGLLTDYASEFEDLDQLGMVRYVTNLAVETVIEKTSAHKLLERVRDLLPGGDEWDQEAGLLDSEYQLAMVRYREEHMLAGVARRLKAGIDRKRDAGAVFSEVQDHVAWHPVRDAARPGPGGLTGERHPPPGPVRRARRRVQSVNSWVALRNSSYSP
ncbi:hypothetical protein SMICM304S_06945 [Streptomyces microflavus]